MTERKRRSDSGPTQSEEARLAKRTTLRLRPDERAELDDYAASIGETLSAAVMRAVRESRDRRSDR